MKGNNMKKYEKILVTLVAVLALAGVVFAEGLQRHAAGIFGGTAFGTGTNTVIVGPVQGQVAIVSMSLSCTPLVTMKKFPASLETKAIQDVNSSTNIYVEVDSNGAIFGSKLAATDWLIISDASTNAAGKQLRDITALGSVSTQADGTVYVNAKIIDEGGTACVESNGVVYVVKAADIVTRTVNAQINDALYQGIGYPNMPFAIQVTSTNAESPMLSGMWEAWE